jgi:hypothetical protein
VVCFLLRILARLPIRFNSRAGGDRQPDPHRWQQQESEETETAHPPTSLGMNKVSRAVGSNWRIRSDVPLPVRFAAM